MLLNEPNPTLSTPTEYTIYDVSSSRFDPVGISSNNNAFYGVTISSSRFDPV